MHKDIIDSVIFAPGHLGADLASGLHKLGHEVTLFSPGYELEDMRNIHPDLSLFEKELEFREDSYTDLLKKHPLVFISLARQVQAELIMEAYRRANRGEFDIIHIYTNEEEIAIVFAEFCQVPVVFTHHEPFNFLAKYRSNFPKYKSLPWISISLSQRQSMPSDANFIGNIYHGLEKSRFIPNLEQKGDYFAYFGRIIEPKGVHLAITAAKRAGVKLKLAGKHYTGYGKDKYWDEIIEPQIDGEQIDYVGFLDNDKDKESFLGNAKALLVPSIWEEPFGMVMIEALACGTPIIGLDSGAIPEIVEEGITGYIIECEKFLDENKKEQINEALVINKFVSAIQKIEKIALKDCRKSFERRFTLERMCKEHEEVYYQAVTSRQSRITR